MRRGLLVALLCVVAVIVQTAVLPRFELAGFRPDLLMLVTVLFALRDGSYVGVRVGFGAGLLQDLLLTQTAMGTSALVLMALAFGVGRVRHQFASDAIVAPVAVALLATMVGTFGFGVLSALFGSQTVTASLLLQACVLTGIYNALVAPLFVWAVDGIDTLLPVPEPALT